MKREGGCDAGRCDGRAAMRLVAFAVLAAGLMLAADAGAQGMRRDRGGASRDTSPSRETKRELPSLGVDLLLSERQLTLWRVFERDIRDLAELDRARRRHLMSLRQAGEGPADASSLIGSLAEDERMKSEAATDMKRDFAALYAQLDDNQKRTLDRRVVQSQTDPLGR
jgi:hypothetical protein